MKIISELDPWKNTKVCQWCGCNFAFDELDVKAKKVRCLLVFTNTVLNVTCPECEKEISLTWEVPYDAARRIISRSEEKI